MLRLILGRLASLQIRKTPCLSMDIPNLLVAHDVERPDLLPRRRPHRLLVVVAQTVPRGARLVGDAVGLVDGARLVGGFVLAVEVGQRLREAVADAVLVVERDGVLDHLVGKGVAVGEILGDDA